MTEDAHPKQKTSLHLRLTCGDWIKSFHQMDRSELGVFYYIKTLDPFGDRTIEFNSNAVSKALKLHRTSVSRALKSLAQKGLISLEIVTAKVSTKVCQKVVCMDAQEVCMDAQEVCMDAQEVCMDAQEVCMDAQLHSIERARAQTYSDLNKTNSNSTDSPLTPQVFAQGEGDEIMSIEVEIVLEEEPTQGFLSNAQTTTEIIAVQENSSIGVTIPARENENNFQPLTGKNPKTGREYYPWQGLVTENGRSHFANNPEFVTTVAKSLASKYSIYKKMIIRELLREADKYIERAQYRNERLPEIEGYWRDFCQEPVLPEMTVEDIKQMSVRSNLMAMLKGVVQ